MIRHTKLLAILFLGTAAVGTFAWGRLPSIQGPLPETEYPHKIYGASSSEMDIPEVTPAQMLDLLRAYLRDEPLPHGASVLDVQGEVTAIKTGRIDRQDRSQTVITVTDDTSDMDSVDIYVNGVLARTATRQNGLIEDLGSGESAATISLWLDEIVMDFIRVEWAGSGPWRIVHHFRHR